jgi:hypothetical protein
MSRNSGSLPSTPLINTPTLPIPSPTRTPSPLPLFSTGGPYSYSGQITRKYAARFKHVDNTRNSVKDVEEAWAKKAKGKGLELDELAKGLEKEYTWDEKLSRNLESIKSDVPVIQIANSEEGEMDDKNKTGDDKRLSLEEDQFVDALSSPLQKPRDWPDLPSMEDG